ncbi:MAG: AIR synthase-related protein, partial [Phycisphaerales bacterium]
IAEGLVRSAHDASEGGVLVAAAEMAFAGGLGASIDLDSIGEGLPAIAAAFAETPSRYLHEVAPASLSKISEMLGDLPWRTIGGFDESGLFAIRFGGGEASLSIDSLRDAWDSGARIDA